MSSIASGTIKVVARELHGIVNLEYKGEKVDVQGLEPWTLRKLSAKRTRYHCAKRP